MLRKKVAHLTTVHHPQDARIFYRQCQSLAPLYQTYLLAPVSKNQTLDDVQIIGLGTYNSRLFRMSVLQFKCLYQALKLKADLYHFHDPELIPTGLILKLFGRRVIYDVHEDVPKDILLKQHIAKWIRYPLAKTAQFFEWLASQFCDGIMVVTPDIARRFPPQKTYLIRNYPKKPGNSSQYQAYQQRQNDLIYIGSITQNRGLAEMVGATLKTNTTLQLVGSLSKDIDPATLEQHDSIHYQPWLPAEQLAEHLANSKIGLVILHPTPTFLTSYPLKLFEYMAFGLPVIASDFPEWRAIIDRYQCGLVVDPFNQTAICDAIEYLLNHPQQAHTMGQNGYQAILSELNWENELVTLKSAYETLIAQ